MQATQDRTAFLNKLLRGEIAATETYVQALQKVGNEPGSTELQRVRDDHREAANFLRQHIHELGGKPDQDSGVWGYFAKAVEGSAKLFGNTAAFKALKEGEEHGIKLYEEAVKDENLPGVCKEGLRTHLLPRMRAHIATLDRLMNQK